MASHQNRVVSPRRLEAPAAFFLFFIFFLFFAFETLALLQARLLGVRARVQGEPQGGSIRGSWGSCTSPRGADFVSGPHSRRFRGAPIRRGEVWHGGELQGFLCIPRSFNFNIGHLSPLHPANV